MTGGSDHALSVTALLLADAGRFTGRIAIGGGVAQDAIGNAFAGTFVCETRSSAVGPSATGGGPIAGERKEVAAPVHASCREVCYRWRTRLVVAAGGGGAGNGSRRGEARREPGGTGMTLFDVAVNASATAARAANDAPLGVEDNFARVARSDRIWCWATRRWGERFVAAVATRIYAASA